MKKLKPRMDELTVESFPAGDANGGTDTVHGAERVPTPPYHSCYPCLQTITCVCAPVI